MNKHKNKVNNSYGETAVCNYFQEYFDEFRNDPHCLIYLLFTSFTTVSSSGYWSKAPDAIYTVGQETFSLLTVCSVLLIATYANTIK